MNSKTKHHCVCGNCVDNDAAYFCEGVVNADDHVIKKENIILNDVITYIMRKIKG